MASDNESVNTKGKLIVFSAPSGSGKTTIVRHLLGLEYLNNWQSDIKIIFTSIKRPTSIFTAQ